MKVIRLKGLLSLLGFTGVLFIILFFFSGTIAKSIFESQLSELNSAEVNIESVEISYWPFNIVINSLEMTDKEKPETNFIELEKAVLAIDTDSLLKGNFVISELQADKIAFAGKRTRPGKVYVKKESASNEKAESAATEDASDKTVLPTTTLELPDINELMAKAGLESEPAFKLVEQKAEETKQSWNEINAWVEDKKKWKEYEDRYNALEKLVKKGNTKQKITALKDLKILNKEIKAEFKIFNENKKKLRTDYNELEKLYNQAKKLPASDYEKLKSSYSFDADNIGNISRLFFDDEISAYITMANNYYKKIKPYLSSDEENAVKVARDKGKVIKFKDDNPEPGLLIKKAGFTAILPSGLFDGKAKDLSLDQTVNNKVSTIELNGSGLKHSKAEIIKAKFDFRNKDKSVVMISYDIEQRKIADYKIAGGKVLPLVMKTADLNLNAKAEIINGSINAVINNRFRHVGFNSNKDQSGNSLSAMIVSSMMKVEEFDVDANITGKFSKLKFKVKSDIDNKINKNLKIRVDQMKKEYEADLKKALYAKYQPDLDKIESSLSGIKKYKKALDEKQDDLEKKFSKAK